MATVHLAGAVGIETGHAAHYSAQHVQARIGSALLYLLDPAAAETLATAALATAAAARGLFAHQAAERLPQQLRTSGQEISLVVRLRGQQPTPRPRGATAAVDPAGRAHITCSVGALTLVCHDQESLHRLVHVAQTAHRVATALWPVGEPNQWEADLAEAVRVGSPLQR